jgi:3-deoxy-D-manno-octulosonic-acid transferase
MIGPLYGVMTTLAGPLVTAYLRRRRAHGKEDPARFGERFGTPGLARPPGRLIWLHAASVGESQSMLPLLERLHLERPDCRLLVTTGTVTSARLMANRLPETVIHQYVPVDRTGNINRFLDHWSPDLAIWVESELWPNLLRLSRKRGIPTLLINARLSDRSFLRWRRAPWLIGPLLDGFKACLAQTVDDAERLRRLGAANVTCVGNLKVAAEPLPADGGMLQRLNALFAVRPVWLAASTHPGEEDIAAEVHSIVAGSEPGLLTVIVPRHPDRGAAIARRIGGLGLNVARRGANQSPTAEIDIYVADTLGELGLFYRLVDVVFIGGSLAAHGGHNPLEAARLDCALLFGPHMENFADIANHLTEGGGAAQVTETAALAEAVAALLADPAARRAMAGRALALGDNNGDVVERVFTAIAPWLPERDTDARA